MMKMMNRIFTANIEGPRNQRVMSPLAEQNPRFVLGTNELFLMSTFWVGRVARNTFKTQLTCYNLLETLETEIPDQKHNLHRH